MERFADGSDRCFEVRVSYFNAEGQSRFCTLSFGYSVRATPNLKISALRSQLTHLSGLY